eukprot:TRINITY_DN9483_c0_g4_i2.p1 TRINITY_DN9483_c0_g4~~TRINITY_DN9483_c0_g4_i2.p1  ORF type:complete len:393 (+),score=71.77 TRINITY_DN9483_c0_g4_i2:265-1443(+)
METYQDAGLAKQAPLYDDSKLAHNLDPFTVIRVWYKDYVEGIEVWYGPRSHGQRIGSARNADSNVDELMFNPGESLVSISGRSGHWLDTVTFATSEGRSITCGKSKGGDPFSLAVPGMVVSSLKYEVGEYLNYIGAVFAPPKHAGGPYVGVTTLPGKVPGGYMPRGGVRPQPVQMPGPSYPYKPVPSHHQGHAAGPRGGYYPGVPGAGQYPVPGYGQGYNPVPGGAGGYGYGGYMQPIRTQTAGKVHEGEKIFDDYTEVLKPLMDQGCRVDIEEVGITASDNLVVAIECLYTITYPQGNVEKKKLSHVGGEKGMFDSPKRMTVKGGDMLCMAKGRSGELIDRLDIATAGGDLLSAGGNGGEDFLLAVPAGRRIVAFGGSLGDYLASLYAYHV